MFIWIPGEVIALITFPGVIMHEIAHRFVCDILKVPVYEINYFNVLDKNGGHVIHAGANSFWGAFLIGVAPLFVNSLLCMLLTLSKTIVFYLDTDFISTSSSLQPLEFLLYWAGFSMGFNAIPSNQDMQGAQSKASSDTHEAIVGLAKMLFYSFNISGIGPILRIGYAYMLSYALPRLFLPWFL